MHSSAMTSVFLELQPVGIFSHHPCWQGQLGMGMGMDVAETQA